MSKKLLKTAILTIILATLIFSMVPINVNASPTNYDVKLYFHKVSSVTLYGSTTTTTIMNTTSTGYFKSTNQTVSVTCSTNDTYYTLATFYLYPKLAGSLTIPSQTALPLKLYLKADKDVSDIYIQTNLNKTSSTDGSTSEIATTSTYGSTSLSTSVALKSVSGPVVGSAVTVESGYYLVLKIEVKTTSSAPVTVTLYYDTSDCPSRIDRLTVSDHFDITAINTYLGTVAQSDFHPTDTINLTATIVDAFGGYDIASVVMYYLPYGHTTRVGNDTATLLSGTDTSYTVYYYDTYTHSSEEYTGIYWVPYVEVTDRSGNTITESGDKIGIYGPSGQEPTPPPSEEETPLLPQLPEEILGIPIMMFMITMMLLIICVVVAVYIVIVNKRR